MKWLELKKTCIFLYGQNWKGTTKGRNNLKWKPRGWAWRGEGGRERRVRRSEWEREVIWGDGGCAPTQLRTRDIHVMLLFSSNSAGIKYMDNKK